VNAQDGSVGGKRCNSCVAQEPHQRTSIHVCMCSQLWMFALKRRSTDTFNALLADLAIALLSRPIGAAIGDCAPYKWVVQLQQIVHVSL